jgi:hypothetical protein
VGGDGVVACGAVWFFPDFPHGSGLTLIRRPVTNDCLPAANPYIAPQYGPPICGLLTHWNHT